MAKKSDSSHWLNSGISGTWIGHLLVTTAELPTFDACVVYLLDLGTIKVHPLIPLLWKIGKIRIRHTVYKVFLLERVLCTSKKTRTDGQEVSEVSPNLEPLWKDRQEPFEEGSRQRQG